MLKAKRATPEELVPHVIKFAGSSGARFQLICKYCRDLGTISATRRDIRNPKALRKAAERFAEQGWWIDEVPICPKCFIRKGGG